MFLLYFPAPLSAGFRHSQDKSSGISYIPCLEFLNKSRIMTCHIFFKVGQCVLTLSIDIQILSTGSPPPTHKKILFSNLLIYISFDHYLQFSISQIHSRALSYKNRTNFFFEVAPNVSPKIQHYLHFLQMGMRSKKICTYILQ